MKILLSSMQKRTLCINKFINTKAALLLLFLALFSNLQAANIQSTGNGNWNVGSTWSNGMVPTNADDVTILLGHTITVNTAATFNSLTINTGGILTLQSNTDFNGNQDITNNGTLNITGNITTNTGIANQVTATLNWNSGDLVSPNTSTIINHGDFNLNLNTVATMQMDITNKSGGQITRNGGNNQNLIIPTDFTNEAGGRVTMSVNRLMRLTGNFTNEGDFDGSGHLILDGTNCTFIGGTFGDGTGALTLENALTMTGAGGYVPHFFNINHNGADIAATSTTMNIRNGATYSINNFGQNDILGFTSIENNGTLNIGGATNFNTDITNQASGTINWNLGNLLSGNNSAVINHGAMNFNLNTATTVEADFVNKSGGQITRNGGNNQNLIIPTSFTNESGGTVTINSLKLLRLTGNFTNGGDFDGSGTLAFTGTSCTFTGGIFGDGTGTLFLDGALTMTGAGGYVPHFLNISHNGADITATNTTMNIPNGAAYSINNIGQNDILEFTSIENNGTLNIGGATNFNTDITNQASGTINWNLGNLLSGNNSSFINHGVMNFNLNTATTVEADFVNKSGGQITRNGGNNQNLIIPTSFTNESGGTVTINSLKLLRLTGNFTNGGDFDGSGTLAFTGTSCTFTGGIFGDGTGTLFLDGALTMTGAGGYVPHFLNINHGGADITATGTTMNIPNGATYNINIGGDNQNDFLNFNSIENNGTLNIVRATNFNTDITNQASGTINWNLGNLLSGNNSSFINHGAMNFNLNTATTVEADFVNKSGGQITRNGGDNQNLVIPTDFTNELGGTVTVNLNKFMRLTGTLTNAGNFDGSGTLAFTGTSCTFTGGMFGDGTGTLFLDGVLTMTGAGGYVPHFLAINHNGADIAATNTTMNIPNGAAYSINNFGQNDILGFTSIENNGTLNIGGATNFNTDITSQASGTINWNLGNLLSGNNSSFINHGVMNFNLNTATTVEADFVNKSGGQITRNGGNNQNLIIPTSFTNESGGTVTINSLKLLRLTGDFMNEGDFDGSGHLILDGTNCTFIGGAFGDGTGRLTLENALTMTGAAGFVPNFQSINQTNADIDGTGTTMQIPDGATYNFNNGSDWTGFTQITNNSILNVSGSVTIDAPTTNAASGTFNWINGNLISTNNSTISNEGIMHFSAINVATVSLNFHNLTDGEIIKDGSNGNLSIGSSLINDGELVVQTFKGLILQTAETHSGLFDINGFINFNTATSTQITAPIYTNNGTTQVGTAPLIFSGNATQSINGDGTFEDFSINNANNVIITGDQNLNGTLNFTLGKLILAGTDDFTANAITGADDEKFVVTPSTARLDMIVTTTAVDFPVGATCTAYNPVTLRTTVNSSRFAVRVQNGFTLTPIANGLVDRQWEIERTSGGSFADITFQWDSPAHEIGGFDSGNNFIARHDGSNWNNITTDSGATCAMGVCTRSINNQNTFGAFHINSVPSISISVNPLSVSETGGMLNYTISRGTVNAGDLTINFSISGTAEAGSDFTITEGGVNEIMFNENTGLGSIKILDTETSVNLPVNISSDNTVENGETVIVKLEAPTP